MAHAGYYMHIAVPGSSTSQYGYIQSAKANIAGHCDLHGFESDIEHLEFIHSLPADNKYLFRAAEHVEGGVRGPNPMQRESKAANKWPASTILPGWHNPVVYLYQISSSGELLR